mmetsp:Transcript_27277/g.60047  ORF Transcript_27277/g.60047 Transcript_27277/m.60047 type:complete len:829 (-) Transcript_27277:3-2489(-)
MLGEANASAEEARPASPRGSVGDQSESSALQTGCAQVNDWAAGTLQEQQQLAETLERYFQEDLRHITPNWVLPASKGSCQPVDVAKAVGLPTAVLGALLAGKCRDQCIPVTAERQHRFAEWLYSQCGSLWFTLKDAGAGPECAKGVAAALVLSDRFISLDLACNRLGDAGAVVLSDVFARHSSLVHVNLAANGIGGVGGNALLEALTKNRSITDLDLSSKPGSFRNSLGRQNSAALENLLCLNPVLSKLSLRGNGLGIAGVSGLARGLAGNKTLTSLDLAGNDLGPHGVSLVAEVLQLSVLEELDIADNRAGDEGVLAMARELGALPKDAESVLPDTVKSNAILRCQEAAVTVKRTLYDVQANALGLPEEARLNALAAAAGAIAHLAREAESVPVQLPKLRALSIGSNKAANATIARVEDVLLVNSNLQKLSLDQSPHTADISIRSLVISLPVSTSLRSLSLAQCRLNTSSIVQIIKALALNKSVENLSFKSNPMDLEAAKTIGDFIGYFAKSLRCINLCSCRLDDKSGTAIAAGLANNSALEALHLRDNLLREGAGSALASSLQNHTQMSALTLDLNSIDVRYLVQIKQLIERNARLRERAKEHHYRRRISELEECKQEVHVLANTAQRSNLLKRRAKLKQAQAVQELQDAQVRERGRQQHLCDRLQEVQQARAEVDREINELQGTLRNVRMEGDLELQQLRMEIANVDKKIGQTQKNIQGTRIKLTDFETKAAVDLKELGEELEKAEKAHKSAELFCTAAQRNLDSLATSMKAIEEEVAGGAEPKRRTLSARRASSRSPAGTMKPRPPSGGRTPRRGGTPARRIHS